MSFQDFCNELKGAVQLSLGDEYNVSLVNTDKLNGLTLTSLIILKKGETVTPNIYLEDYYKEFQMDGQLALITERIISLYKSADKKPLLSACLFTDFDTIKNRLYCKLINYDKNTALLNNVPHIRWMDLAVIFCLLAKKDAEGIGSITVKNDLIDRWGITLDTLYSTALKNTLLLFEVSVRPMDDIIRSIVLGQFQAPDNNDCNDDVLIDLLQQQNTTKQNHPMYVASNISGINGAAWLLQRDELCSLSKKIGGKLFILPSSIHEVIIVPYTEDISQDDLYQMVCEVNATQVAADEFLSDNVYQYTSEDDSLVPLF